MNHGEEKKYKNKPVLWVVLGTVLLLILFLAAANQGGAETTIDLIDQYFTDIADRNPNKIVKLLLPEEIKQNHKAGYSNEQLLSTTEFYPDGPVSMQINSWEETNRQNPMDFSSIQQTFRQLNGSEIEDYTTLTVLANVADGTVWEFDFSCVREKNRWYLSTVNASYYSVGFNSAEELVLAYFEAADDHDLDRIVSMYAPGTMDGAMGEYDCYSNESILTEIDALYYEGFYGDLPYLCDITDYYYIEDEYDEAYELQEELEYIQEEMWVDGILEDYVEIELDTGNWGDGYYYIVAGKINNQWYLLGTY